MTGWRLAAAVAAAVLGGWLSAGSVAAVLLGRAIALRDQGGPRPMPAGHVTWIETESIRVAGRRPRRTVAKRGYGR